VRIRTVEGATGRQHRYRYKSSALAALLQLRVSVDAGCSMASLLTGEGKRNSTLDKFKLIERCIQRGHRDPV